MTEGAPDWGVVHLLQNVTSWFHWAAISAVFTFLALLNTARIADRASRQQRERDAVLLEGAAELIEGAVESARCVLDTLHKNGDVLKSVRTAIYIEEHSDMIKEVSSMEQKSFPNIVSMQAYIRAKMGLKIIHSELKKISKYDGSEEWNENQREFFREKISVVEYSVKTLSKEARKINGRSTKDLKFEDHTDGERFSSIAEIERA